MFSSLAARVLLLFDFSSNTSTNNSKVAVFFDIQTDFDAGVDPALNIFQVDDFLFGELGTLGINNFHIEGLKVYPNPANDAWTISTQDQVIRSIEIFNVLGKRVMNLEPNALSTKVNASNLTSGVYFTTISTDLGTASRKLIKQ